MGKSTKMGMGMGECSISASLGSVVQQLVREKRNL